jgi:hypothetical protein
MLRNHRSRRLPPSTSAPSPPNQTARGLLVTESIQTVGIHEAQEAFGAPLRSIPNKKRTRRVQTSNTICGGMTVNQSRLVGDLETYSMSNLGIRSGCPLSCYNAFCRLRAKAFGFTCLKIESMIWEVNRISL